MRYPEKYISATLETGTLEQPLPAPYFRKKFIASIGERAIIRITAIGFYRLFINGKEITKCLLAPYITAPDRLVYFDDYEIGEWLVEGENVIGVWLGNGITNNPGGYPWLMEESPLRCSPRFSLYLDLGDEERNLETDESFLTHPSPIVFDDYRFGERYDARLELDGWCDPNFDDSEWTPAIKGEPPTGKNTMCINDRIVTDEIIAPVKIIPCDDGYIYDFGKNGAGLCELKVKGKNGQRIIMQHGELLKDGRLSLKQEWFDDQEGLQRDEYICRGTGETERFMPHFTYHGFRYVHVKGIAPEQATKDLLTYNFMHSEVEVLADFKCSDETVNALYRMTRRSDLSNLYYFPTDCPHREKHGWTGDAAFSAEHMLQNLTVDGIYHEWLHQLRVAQQNDGLAPIIVPTIGWGYFDSAGFQQVLVEIPWQLWRYRGDKAIIEENADAIWKLLSYFVSHADNEGFDGFGIGDWSTVGTWQDNYTAPVNFTNTMICMSVFKKAAQMFEVVCQNTRARYAESVYRWYRETLRSSMIDFDTMTVESTSQTAQAMALFYGLFEPHEEKRAFKRLIDIIERDGGVIKFGVLGGRVIFHTLSKFSRSDLALEMIIGPKSPSFGDWVREGQTTLREIFDYDGLKICSMNHHFWGDISNWFLRELAGIKINDDAENITNVKVSPSFVDALDFADGYHIMPYGKISSAWQRKDNEIILKIEVPENCKGSLVLPCGYIFEDGTSEKVLKSGEYKARRVSL